MVRKSKGRSRQHSNPRFSPAVYSQHYKRHPHEHRPLPTRPAPSHAPTSQNRSRSIRFGVLGLALLSAIVWGVSELGHLPSFVEAQEMETPAPVAKTPWQAASFPVEDFVAYTSPFGYRDHPFGGRSFHYGLDIAAPMGSYIRAWWEGTVVEVTDDTACGTSAVIESQGWLHIYCHLQGHVVVEVDGDRWLVDHDGGIQIRQGDRVHTGQKIGRIGMTGRTTGPHLHWGMKYNGSWIDPSFVVKAMVEAQTQASQ